VEPKDRPDKAKPGKPEKREPEFVLAVLARFGTVDVLLTPQFAREIAAARQEARR
jgi:hypothetical protein